MKGDREATLHHTLHKVTDLKMEVEGCHVVSTHERLQGDSGRLLNSRIPERFLTIHLDE